MENFKFLFITLFFLQASFAHGQDGKDLSVPLTNPVYQKLLADFPEEMKGFDDFQTSNGLAPEVQTYLQTWSSWIAAGATGTAPTLDYQGHHWVFNLTPESGARTRMVRRDSHEVEEMRIPFPIQKETSSMDNPSQYVRDRVGDVAFDLIDQGAVAPMVYGGNYSSWKTKFLKTNEVAYPIPSPYAEWEIVKVLVLGPNSQPQLVYLVPPIREYVEHHLAMFLTAGAKNPHAYLNMRDRSDYESKFKEDFKNFPVSVRDQIKGAWVVMGYQSTFVQKLATTSIVDVDSGIVHLKLFTFSDGRKMVSLESDATLWGEGTAFLAESIFPYHPAGILFFGSAGYLIRDQQVYDPHSPQKFVLGDDPVLLKNELSPQTGVHYSTFSPLAETHEQVDSWIKRGITSIDVEQSRVAKVIEEFNAKYGTKIRFGATNLITDFPSSTQYPADPRYNLDHVDPLLKTQARQKIVDEAIEFMAVDCNADMHHP